MLADPVLWCMVERFAEVLLGRKEISASEATETITNKSFI